MSGKLSGPMGGKAPEFFIPASYKGHSLKRFTPTVNSKGNSDPTASISNDAKEKPGTLVLSKQADSTKPLLFASPNGVLDLSQYNYTPVQHQSASGGTSTMLKANGKTDLMKSSPHHNQVDTNNGSSNVEVEILTETKLQKAPKRSRFRRPRRNSKLDWLIRILEDKRVRDDGEELEDLQMPKLRKVLNIIFVTLGVCFLLAVITVILYTTFVTDTDTNVRETQSDGSNSVDGLTTMSQNEGSTALVDDSRTAVDSHFEQSNSNRNAGKPPFLNGPPFKRVGLHTPLDVSISRIDQSEYPKKGDDTSNADYGGNLHDLGKVPLKPQDRFNEANYPPWWSRPHQPLPNLGADHN